MNWNEIKKNAWVVLMTGMFALLTGCSSSPPARDAERAVQNAIKEQSEGRIKLVSFKKTNGAEGELMGFKMYVLEFEAEIEFAENCKWNTGYLGSGMSFHTYKMTPQSESRGQAMFDAATPGTVIKRGQKAELSGVVRFVKKEKGWSVDGLELKSAKLVTTANVSPEQFDKFKKAFEDYRTKAEKGDANAQYELAKIYRQGKGVEKNLAEAVRWFRSSAEQGYALGQNGLGMMYKSGEGVAKDYSEALRWFHLAANQNNTKALVNLGDMYDLGWGVSQDRDEAIMFYKKAAEAGDGGGQWKLGVAYDRGRGVEKDKTEAMKWYRKAADQNFRGAPLEISRMYNEGDGVVQNRSTATKWYLKAIDLFQKDAEEGDPWAQLELGKMLLLGASLERYFSPSGRIAEQLDLGKMLLVGAGTYTNETLGLKWLRKAAMSDNDSISKNAEEFIGAFSPEPEYVARRKAGGEKVDCLHNLKNIGRAFLMWKEDHDGKYPFHLSKEKGGVMESCSVGSDGFDRNSHIIFQTISNELMATKYLVCPSDSSKTVATDFQHLSSLNASYQVHSGLEVRRLYSNEILVRCPIHGAVAKCDGHSEFGSK